jgi:hypothetical protein
MLRWTNRLKEILIEVLESEEGGIDFPVEDWDPEPRSKARFREIREAEFIPTAAPSASRETRTSSKRQKLAVAEGVDAALEHEFPPEFRWDELMKWLSPPFCQVERLEVERRKNTVGLSATATRPIKPAIPSVTRYGHQ